MSDSREEDDFEGNISLIEFVDSDAEQEMSVGDQSSTSSASQVPPSEDEGQRKSPPVHQGSQGRRRSRSVSENEPGRKYRRTPEEAKNAEYHERRERNNQSVKKTREKHKMRDEELEVKYTDLQKEFYRQEGIIAEQRHQIQGLQTEVRHRNESIGQLRGENKSLLGLQEESQGLRGQIQSLQAENQGLQCQICHRNGIIEQQQRQIEQHHFHHAY
uniref:BZIP domain-containing protein n=1 Tax=Steinernema glaseri TaxID=37863 RepID=A0A1I8A137_9BILA